jgi:hypothetical protein
MTVVAAGGRIQPKRKGLAQARQSQQNKSNDEAKLHTGTPTTLCKALNGFETGF